MSVTASGSALPAIAATTAALRYELQWIRSADSSSECLFVDTETGETLFSTKNAAWDDAIPWEAGSYQASSRVDRFSAPCWTVDPAPASRHGIQIHVGNYSDNSHGCLVANKKFLEDIKSFLGDDSFRVVVQNDYPQSLSLYASKTAVQEGSGIELTVSMSRAASKDMWVKVELDSSSVAKPADLELDTAQLTKLNQNLYGANGKLDGYYVRIVEGQTEGKIFFKTKSDGQSEQPELARFKITDYAASDDKYASGKITENDFRFYRDNTKILISKDSSEVDVTIRDQVLPVQESGSSGNYPFTVAVASGQQFSFSFDAYSIPDSLRIFDGSKVLFSTSGLVSGSYSGTFTTSSTTTGTLTCVVDGNADSATAWNFYLDLLDANGSSNSRLAYFASEPHEFDESQPVAAFPPTSAGSIVSGGTNSHIFNGMAGHVYLVTVVSADNSLNPAFNIIDNDGFFVAEEYNSVSSTTAFSYLTFSEDEQAIINVFGENYTEGKYNITYDDVTGQINNVISVAASFEQLEEAASTSEGGDGTIVITRDGDLTQSLTVRWNIVPDVSSGANGSDISGPLSGTVTFAEQEYSKTIDIRALQDGFNENRESFTFSLTDAGGASILYGSNGELSDSVTFSIIDSSIMPMNKIGTYASDYITGGARADILRGSFGNDTIFGFNGSDSIFGEEDRDMIFGGLGNDRLLGGAGNDWLNGGTGNDTLNGGLGIDWVSFMGEGRAARVDLAITGPQATGHGRDVILNIENIRGGAGNDILLGNAQANLIRGGNGVDRILGRQGNDRLEGNAGADFLDGGMGRDVLIGGLGNDRLLGGTGNDTLNGGAGIDRVSFMGEGRAARVDLAITGPQATGHGRDVILNIENIHGGAGNDILRGNAQANLIQGGNGADRILGRQGNDRLEGNAGADFLDGGLGRDVLIGGIGNDQLKGGAGNDTFVFRSGFDRDVILDFQNNIDTIRLLDFGVANFVQARSLATQNGSNVVFDFGDGDILTVRNTTINALGDDLLFV